MNTGTNSPAYSGAALWNWPRGPARNRPCSRALYADRHGCGHLFRHGRVHEGGVTKGPVSAGFFRNADRHSQPSQRAASTDRLLADCRGHHHYLRHLGNRRRGTRRSGATWRSRTSRPQSCSRRQGARQPLCVFCRSLSAYHAPVFTESGMEASMKPDAPSCKNPASSFLTEKTDRKIFLSFLENRIRKQPFTVWNL